MNRIIDTTKEEVIIDSVKTSIICRRFTDYLQVLITQTGKIGTVVKVVRDNPEAEFIGGHPVFTVKVLLGLTSASVSAFAVAAAKSLGIVNKPLILGFTLKDPTPTSVESLTQFLRNKSLINSPQK